MKKTLTLLAVILATMSTTFAQQTKATKSVTSDNPNEEKRHLYLGLSSGINNIASLFGLSLEVPFSENMSGKLGVGVGGWGSVIGIAGKYYKQYPVSWSFGVGYSTASGYKEIPLGLTTRLTPNTTEQIKMNADRAHMIDLVTGKSWGNKVKFNLELGYSIRVNGGAYTTVDKTIVLSETSTTAMNLLSPGGLIIGLGLTFRL
jgi:hypothetical protein